MAQEVEIKFVISDLRALARKLRSAGFTVRTRRTHEMNTLFDYPDHRMRKRGDVLRIRRYGKLWTLTHKSKGNQGKHKSRTETETQVADGQKLAAILESIGLIVSFRYEKFRTEWWDGKGLVVVDETPIGNIAEIEGPAKWIDATAKKLGVAERDYCTLSYADLFQQWNRKSRRNEPEMTFAAVGSR
jgi:adenylate cyclase, class 2